MAQPLWLLGAFLSLVGSVCTNFGVNIQKYSQNQEQALEEHKRRPYYSAFTSYYWIGFFLVFLGSFGDFSALGFAAQSIVAPIGSLTLVANIFFGHYFLKEQLGRSDLIGTILICVGAALSVSFGSHEDKTFDSRALRALYRQTSFQVYAVFVGVLLLARYPIIRFVEPMIFVGVLLLALYAIIRFVEPMKQKLLSLFEDLEMAAKERRRDKVMDIQNEIKLCEAKYAKFEKFHPFFYCFLSGVCGGQSLLFAKSVVELLFETVRGENQFAHPWVYLFLFCMFFFIVLQLHFLAIALKYFDALYCVPVFQCFFIIGGTVGGALYFQEFADFNALQSAMFPIGVLVTLTGVYILSKREMTKSLWERNALERLEDFHLENPEDDEMGKKLARLGSKTFGRLRSMSLGGSSVRLVRINSYSKRRASEASSDDMETRKARSPSAASSVDSYAPQSVRGEKFVGKDSPSASTSAYEDHSDADADQVKVTIDADADVTLSKSKCKKLEDIPESRSPSRSKEPSRRSSCGDHDESVHIDVPESENVLGMSTISRSDSGNKLQFSQISPEEMENTLRSEVPQADADAEEPQVVLSNLKGDDEVPQTQRGTSSEAMLSRGALAAAAASDDFHVPPRIKVAASSNVSTRRSRSQSLDSSSSSGSTRSQRSMSAGAASPSAAAQRTSNAPSSISGNKSASDRNISLPSSPGRLMSLRKQISLPSGQELASAPLATPSSKSQSYGASLRNLLNFSPRTTSAKKPKKESSSSSTSSLFTKRRSLPFPLLSMGSGILKRSEILDNNDDSDSEVDDAAFMPRGDEPQESDKAADEREAKSQQPPSPRLIGWASSPGRPISAPGSRPGGVKVSARSMPKGAAARPKRRNLSLMAGPRTHRTHRRGTSFGVNDSSFQLDDDILAIRERLQRRRPPASLQSAALHDMRADLFTGVPFLTSSLFARRVLDKQNDEGEDGVGVSVGGREESRDREDVELRQREQPEALREQSADEQV